MSPGDMRRSVTVRVPATTANLGPGFDCLGMALQLYNTFTLRLGQPFAVRVSGEAAEILPKTEDNAVIRAMDRLFAEAGVHRGALPPFALEVDNQIPVSSGLGSSASAIVAGLVLGNALLEEYAPDRKLGRDRLLRLATELEGHPDNVAPALLGGGVLAFHDRAGLRTAEVPIPPNLRFVAATPEFALPTELARRVLPKAYPRDEAVENVAQCARLLLALLKPDLDLLRGGMLDYFHEPYRKPLVPGADEVERAAMAAGAYAVTLSGAGPTLLAWCKPDLALRVADEMTLAWRNAGTPCRALVVRPVHGETRAHWKLESTGDEV
ncbi:homoserine kinase [Alicyclobacillus mali]|uniref:Homoserine kinase n=1 Tax=Alicyclobacillus mali (ex Roth et al. 2021) TaxID=1123961 RepID=A0ABS0F187_9BACL|nr:homoserine kinase [Alicyclobacillus mali (ex Roth et al. 2021)]MBF8377030.1 homoserine kinase [Alicyclobacillus mali (ex Roth et al. 2021)]MCL6489759.1 homoserine kinase [Alicyclobacillus mali (ex Roth et al. 2021)]